jgi:hypothetical protein
MVYTDVKNCTKAELFNILYELVFNDVDTPYYVQVKRAETDGQRFKVPISLR